MRGSDCSEGSIGGGLAFSIRFGSAFFSAESVKWVCMRDREVVLGGMGGRVL